MKTVSVKELKKFRQPVDLSLKSMEGNLYIASADIESLGLRGLPVIDSMGLPLKARSVAEMREYFSGVHVRSAQLVFDEAYNEMVSREERDAPSAQVAAKTECAQHAISW